MSKNIEYVQSEVVGSEMVETATDSSKLGDLITEAWATQYARSTGLKVVPQPAVQVETEVVELKSLLLALLRAVWKTTCRLFNGHSLGEVFSAAVISNKSVDDAYEWLLGRITAEYLPTPSLPQPQDAPHLVENLQAGLGSRRISNGDSMPDGISLVRLLSSYRNSVTEIVDDNLYSNNIQALITWFMNDSGNQFNGINKIVLNWTNCTTNSYMSMYSKYRGTKVYFPYLETCDSNYIWSYWYNENYASRTGGFAQSEIHLDAFKTKSIAYGNGPAFTVFERIYMPVFESGSIRIMGEEGSSASQYYVNPYTKYMFIGCKGEKTDTITLFCYSTANTTITDIEIGEGACQNLTILNIEGLTAANIYSHILQRLKQDEADCGEGVTITLGATNLAKLEDEQHPEYASLLAELRTTYKYTFA